MIPNWSHIGDPNLLTPSLRQIEWKEAEDISYDSDERFFIIVVVATIVRLHSLMQR